MLKVVCIIILFTSKPFGGVDPPSIVYKTIIIAGILKGHKALQGNRNPIICLEGKGLTIKRIRHKESFRHSCSNFSILTENGINSLVYPRTKPRCTPTNKVRGVPQGVRQAPYSLKISFNIVANKLETAKTKKKKIMSLPKRANSIIFIFLFS